MTPAPRRTVADQVFDQLLDAILSGEQPPGSQLATERDLATQTGVNRQAVREALQRLRQMDLVEIVHGGGITVLDWQANAGLALLPILLVRPGRAVDPSVARSIMELRASIGADAARMCATRARSGTAERLVALVDEMDAIESDPERWNDLGFAFWQAVVDGADNVAYRLSFNTLRHVAEAVAPVLPDVLGIEWAQRSHYRRVAEAVATGDAEAAEDSARILLARGVEAVNLWLATIATLDLVAED